MLKFSTKGRYGVRAMMELARHPPGETVLMSTIAERQEISRKYLHALLTALRLAGLVRSVRGAQGGYTLGRDPAQIHILDVVEALEGPVALVDCVFDDKTCHRSADCVSRQLWRELSEALRRHLAAITLADLAAGDVSKAGCALAAAAAHAHPGPCPGHS